MISNLPPDLPPVLNLDIGDLSFILWLEQQSDDPTTYCFYDFFDVNARFSIAGDSSKPITQYALLGKKELLNTNNLQTTKLLPAFQELPKQPYVYERANQMLLDLLSAYDETNGTRQDLLKLAFDFSCWLANAPEEMLGKKLSYINKFQVIRRMRELCKNEKDQLCVIAADPETPEELKVGAYLLLDSQDMAEYHFKNLSSEKQSTITNYPIRLFWKTNIQE